MPAICRSAADLSAWGQTRTKLLVRAELIALILAGVAGLHSLRVGPARLDVLAALAGVLFLLSLASLITRGLTKPEESWYAGRAGAESVRTSAWRYAVGGDPYPLTLSAAEADDAFLDRLTQILDELRELQLASTGSKERQLTDGMRRLRAAGFAERRAVYRRDRVENQITWYTEKADGHERAARRWLRVAATASLAGVVVAVLRMLGWVDLDLLGVAGACASAAIAWNQLNQNRNLVSAYRVTASELSIILARMETVTEDRWAAFVSDAEDAVSREHTLWLARHGHPVAGIR
jgi:hypothetical protein